MFEIKTKLKISNRVVIMLHNTIISFKMHGKNMIYYLIWSGNMVKTMHIIARFS